jgi:hypothetical protein
VALIELSLDPPAPPARATPPPAYFYRRLAPALAVLMVLALGGAAPTASVLWQRLGAVPLAAEADFDLLAGVLYTTEPDANPRVVTAWRTDPVRRLWSVPDPGTALPFFVRDATDDVAVLQTGRTVAVLDAHTGAARWTSPAPVQRLTGGVALLQLEEFRPGTEYDPESGDPGRLFGTGAVLHTEPARSTELRGVEPATGRRLWSYRTAGSVFTAWAGAPAEVLVVLSADRLVVLSPSTGAVLRERAVPPIDGRTAAGGEVSGDTVLVHYGAFGTGGRVTAYALDTLRERWSHEQPDPAGNPANCSGLTCTKSRKELVVLDPVTGSVRWRAADSDVLAFGEHRALEVQGANAPVRTVDAVTGRPLADLGGWREYFPIRPGAGYILTRSEGAEGTGFALLSPGRSAVQPLGRIPGRAAQCRAVPGLVACQVSNRVEIWAYRG